MRTINRERGLEFKIIKKMCLCLGVGFVGQKVFVRCDMNDVTIPHALCIEYYVISFREG